MKSVIRSNAFDRDLRKAAKRGKELRKLYEVVECLAGGETLSNKHMTHPLKGSWKPKWDCHIEPDWLHVYETTDSAVILVRTGTHSDLFG